MQRETEPPRRRNRRIARIVQSRAIYIVSGKTTVSTCQILVTDEFTSAALFVIEHIPECFQPQACAGQAQDSIARFIQPDHAAARSLEL